VPDLRDNISSKMSLYHVPGLRDTVPHNISVPCARFAWHNSTKTSVCRVTDLRDNIFLKTFLYRVPGIHDTIALNRLCAVCQIFVKIFSLKRLCNVCQVWLTQFPKNACAPRMTDLRDNLYLKTSTYRVPGLHDTIALKHLCAVCEIYEIIFLLKRLCAVCQGYVTQLP